MCIYIYIYIYIHTYVYTEGGKKRERERKYGNVLAIGESGVGYMKIHSFNFLVDLKCFR